MSKKDKLKRPKGERTETEADKLVAMANRIAAQTEGLSFADALEHMKADTSMQRAGWNGKGMFVYYVPTREVGIVIGEAARVYGLPEGSTLVIEQHLMMRTAQGTIIPWLASQSDLLANDWRLYRPEARPEAPPSPKVN